MMRILLIAPSLASFVKKDQLILNKLADVETIVFKSAKGVRLIIGVIQQIFKVFSRIKYTDIVFIWFADYHSLIPVLAAKLFRKKILIVLGGTDVNCLPELGYGYCSNRIRKIITKYSIARSDFLLPVDESLKTKVLQWLPNHKERIAVVPTCFDESIWFCDTKKEKVVLTVGIFGSYQRACIKGIDLFIEVAFLLPDYEFEIVRAENGADNLFEIPSNVKVYTERLSDEDLRLVFSRAKIYAQLSLSEGLPSSVCEAMLCECLPIGTDVGGMRTAIADTGIIVGSRDARSIAEKIRKLMNDNSDRARDCRNHIKDNFTFELREKRLREIICSLTQ